MLKVVALATPPHVVEVLDESPSGVALVDPPAAGYAGVCLGNPASHLLRGGLWVFLRLRRRGGLRGRLQAVGLWGCAGGPLVLTLPPARLALEPGSAAGLDL
eukprot:5295958-Pyramimonas_sp.AAC.1